jgi:hypothetical protein
MKNLTRALTLLLLFAARPVRAGDVPVTPEADLRYRHDALERGEEEVNHRQRVRVRFGASSELRDDLSLRLRIASGDDDPVSTNQTLTDAFSKKSLTLDLAYFDYRPVKGLSLLAGKQPNPFFKPGDSQLVWDGDLTPEGLTLSFSRQGARVKWFATGSSFWVMDRRDGEPDAFLLAGQAGAGVRLGEDFLLVASGAFYDYTGLKGRLPVYDDAAFGNTVDVDGRLVNDYNLVDGGLELRGKAWKLPFSVFGNVAVNLAAEDGRTAWLAGVSLGDPGKPKGWRARYTYRQVGSDAVFGTFSDSDFGGGGTGTWGHLIDGSFTLNEHLSFLLTLFISRIDDGDDTRYHRIQLDMLVKY